MNSKLACLVALLGVSSFAFGDAYTYSGSQVFNITYEGNAVADFPLLLKLDATKVPNLYTKVKNAGADLLFTSVDGATEYPFEVDTWNPDGTSLVWVKVPNFAKDVMFKMWYGCTAKETNPSSTAVWTGYDYVCHVNGNANDSTANAVVGSLNQTSEAKGRDVEDAVIGAGYGTTAAGYGSAIAAWVFKSESTKDRSRVLDDPIFTMSFWIRYNGTPTAWNYICGLSGGWTLDVANIAQGGVQMAASSGYKTTFKKEGMFNEATWLKIDAVYNNTTFIFYLNGEPVGNPFVSGSGATIGYHNWLAWGGVQTGNQSTIAFSDAKSIAADFDECRVYGSAADPDRVAADYAVAMNDYCEAFNSCMHEHTAVTGACDATCTKPGSTGTETCDDCHEVLRAAEVIPALGHDWSELVITKEPTDEETGLGHHTCQRCHLYEEVVIPKISRVIALGNIAGAVAVGHKFTLPETVNGLDAFGNVLEDVAVEWESQSVVYDRPGLYEVAGCASDDSSLVVKASIRVEEVELDYENVAPRCSQVDANDPNKTPTLLNAVVSDTVPDNANLIWNDVIANRGAVELYVNLAWDSEVLVSKVKVCYNTGHKAPASYVFSTDFEGKDIIGFKQGDVVIDGLNAWVEFTFNEPVSLKTLRCFFGNPGWLVIKRIAVYALKGESEVIPSSNAMLSDLQADDKTVLGFDPEVANYTAYNCNAITVATPMDNAGVTILPKNEEGTAFVITVAEDGIATKTYKVAMPTATLSALRNISLVAGKGEAISLPETVMALTAEGGLIGEIPVEWENVPVSYDQEGTYIVTGHALGKADLKVTASIRVKDMDAVYENVSPSAMGVASDDPLKKEADVKRVISEIAPADDSVDWVTSNRQQGDLVDTLTWAADVTIAKVRVWYSVMNGHMAPSSYVFSSDSDGKQPIEFTASEPQAVGGHRWVEFTFKKPTQLSTLRCFFGSPVDPGNPGNKKWLVVERIWAYEVVSSSNAKPENILCNGVAVKDFDPDNTEKIWKIASRKNIAITSDDNIAVTVLPEDANRIIRIVTVSEDGLSTKTYKLQLANGFILFVL